MIVVEQKHRYLYHFLTVIFVIVCCPCDIYFIISAERFLVVTISDCTCYDVWNCSYEV